MAREGGIEERIEFISDFGKFCYILYFAWVGF